MSPRERKTQNVCIGDGIEGLKLKLTFVDSHRVCLRFYIQMSFSHTPLRRVTLSRKLISYALPADRKLTLTLE